MDLVFYLFLSLIVFFGIIAILYLIIYNKIQKIKIRIDEAETIIDDKLRFRYDQMLKASEIIFKDLNKEYFKDLESLKNKKISNFDMDRKITESISLYETLKNDNRKLEDSNDLKEVDLNLKTSEEKLEAAKAYFNMNTSKLNELVRTFPAIIVARIHNVKIRPYFDGKNLNDDDINDFKL